jgi:hypothetical protein
MTNSNDGFDIPVSEPLPAGIEVTEVDDGEKSELMQRALEDKAITEQKGELESPPEKTWKPTPVWEVPDHPLKRGELAQHDGSTRSAIRIAEWLNANKASAYVVPEHKTYPAFIRVDAFQGRGSELIGRRDYVFLDEDGLVRVINPFEAAVIFRVENDDTPLGSDSQHL